MHITPEIVVNAERHLAVVALPSIAALQGITLKLKAQVVKSLSRTTVGLY